MKTRRPTQLEFEDTSSDKEIPVWNREHSLWGENTYAPGADFRPSRNADEYLGMAEDSQAALVSQITSILDREKDVRDAVFSELYVKQRELREQIAMVETENASRLAFWDETTKELDAQSKQKWLDIIRAEINYLEGEINQNKAKAAKLMNKAVLYAKRIGDRLLTIKWYLLKHGEYEDWIEENFDGGISTARAYTRIAKLKNWKKIVPELYRPGGLTLEKALALIRKRPPEKKRDEDNRRQDWIKILMQWFCREVNSWSDSKLRELAWNSEFREEVEAIADRLGYTLNGLLKRVAAIHNRQMERMLSTARKETQAESQEETF